nr:MAG TPA: hypothetical protein [Caudoviricetes sp.]
MARFEVEGLDELLKNMTFLDADRLAPMMLEEAAPPLEANVKRRAGSHRDTGAMETSIKTTRPHKNGNGYSICTRPTGKDKKGVRNMEKAVYMEFGTSKQAATPIISPAVRESEAAVLEKMQEVFDREVGSE